MPRPIRSSYDPRGRASSAQGHPPAAGAHPSWAGNLYPSQRSVDSYRRDPLQNYYSSSSQTQPGPSSVPPAPSGHQSSPRTWSAPSDHRELPPIPRVTPTPTGYASSYEPGYAYSPSSWREGPVVGPQDYAPVYQLLVQFQGYVSMRESSLLFFGAKWFCPNGLRDLQGIASEFADFAGNLPCGIPMEALFTPDWRLRMAV